MNRIYNKLAVISLTPEQHAKTCNYWYVVQESWGPHTAFTTRTGLNRWMTERGLDIDQTQLKDQPVHSVVSINGEYAQKSHMSYDEFYSLPNVIVETKTLSNGDYTLARITQDQGGIRTVHTLNPNCKHRPIFDYRLCADEFR